MDQTLLLWLSVIAISALGTLAHFLYDLAHQPKALGIFTAVNESTWEHIKIAITPTLLWSLIDGYLYGASPNYFPAKLTSLLVLTFFIPLVYYSYRRLAQKSILPIDISIFIIAIVLAQLTFFAVINLPSAFYFVSYFCTVGTFIFFGAYMTLTLMPQKAPIFKDPITGKYGFLAHRDFFKSRRKHKK